MSLAGGTVKLSQDQIDMLDHLIAVEGNFVDPGLMVSHMSKGTRRQAKKSLEKKGLVKDRRVTDAGLNVRGRFRVVP